MVCRTDGLRNKPSGVVRITAAEFPATYLIWPKLSGILPQYPDITVEVTVDYNRTDIVSERFDAGVRLGDEINKDMIAVRISADQRIAVVGSPAYFANQPRPRHPADLAEHNCINLRLPTHGGLLVWDFQKGRKELEARVSGQWIYNSSGPILRAALAGQLRPGRVLHRARAGGPLVYGERVRQRVGRLCDIRAGRTLRLAHPFCRATAGGDFRCQIDPGMGQARTGHPRG